MSDRQLIEEALPLDAVNLASGKEKSAQRGHISTMHLWWARRPLAMSRAVVVATLLPDPGDEGSRRDMLNAIALAAPFQASNKPGTLATLRTLISQAYPKSPPKILDCFAGGGAIPIEALRLGCDVTALDLNPVAHLIEKACLEYPQRFGNPDGAITENHLADDFEYWALRLRTSVEDDLKGVFPPGPNGSAASIYYWCRTMRCANPACAREIPLMTTRWLARSTRRRVWVELHTKSDAIAITVHTAGTPTSDPSRGTIKSASVTCPACGASSKADDVRKYGKSHGFGAQLYAVCDISNRTRSYRVPTQDEIDGALTEASKRLETLPDLDDGTSGIPDEGIVKSQYRRFNNLVYGIDSFGALFNTRQRYVLGRLALAVRQMHSEMIASGLNKDYAKALATYLAFCVDRIADYNSTFCGAHVTLEAIRNTFPRQAIAMTWDYTEINPLSRAPAAWTSAMTWVGAAIRYCSNVATSSASVVRGDAQSLPFEDGQFDALITDPPYYDAIQYGDLSDFFFVWLKRSIGPLYPELFATPLTPKKQEVIETRADKKSAEYVSHEEFEQRLQRALVEMARVTKAEGIVAIVFAHTDVEAWERLLRGLRFAGLVVTTSWPMRSESSNRSTSHLSAVLGSSVVLVCRKEVSRGEAFFDDVVRELEARIAQRLDRFDSMGLLGADYFVSAIGPAFEVFAKYSRVTRLSGAEVDIPELMTLARQVVARRAMGKLLGDEAIGALDPVSLMYLTWRWAYDGEAIPADEAYKLERALDVDLATIGGPQGLAVRNGSNFALRGPEDRKGLKLGASPSMIDVMQSACLLWDGGRRKELEVLLGETGMGSSSAFWSLVRALAQVLPEGNRERTMLLGLAGNQEALASAAAGAAVAAAQIPLPMGATDA